MAIRDSSFVARIPSEPDFSIRTQLEQATSSESIDCCCQIELNLFKNSKSILYSFDDTGARKTSGGDEFYVRYEEYIVSHDANSNNDETSPKKLILSQAVAIIDDQCDGSYELDFRTTPMYPLLHKQSDTSSDDESKERKNILRNITIFFEYTDNIGFLSPPMKLEWMNGGYSHRRFDIDLPCNFERPLIREFVPPSLPMDLQNFDQVFAFGDSTFCQFFRQRPNKKGKYYFQPNLRIIGEKVRMGLNSKTVDAFVDLLKDDEVEQELSNACSSSRKALIIGSCLWDILNADDTLQGAEYIDHHNACKTYIHSLRQRYPNVTIIWKSPMAVHIHWVDLQRVVDHDRNTATLFGINRIKYMSSSRSSFLYKLQKDLMEELNVPMLDLYEATHLSADLLYPSDGRHYKPDLNRKMLGWFYRSSQAIDGSKHEGDGQKNYYRQVV